MSSWNPIEDEQVPVQLTAREIEVLTEVIAGKRHRDIAGELFISPRTVDFHVSSIYDKLGVSNRLMAYHRAVRLGIIEGA